MTPGTPLVFLAALLIATPPDLPAQFGSRVHARSGSACVSGDFDGDGITDTACLVQVTPMSGQAGFAAGVTVVDRLFADEPLNAGSRETALAITLAGGKRKFVISGGAGDGGDYFDTPIWASHPPLSVAAPNTKVFRGFRRAGAPVRHDILVLGTEAGIDTALYWNGNGFALFAPDDEP